MVDERYRLRLDYTTHLQTAAQSFLPPPLQQTMKHRFIVLVVADSSLSGGIANREACNLLGTGVGMFCIAGTATTIGTACNIPPSLYCARNKSVGFVVPKLTTWYPKLIYHLHGR